MQAQEEEDKAEEETSGPTVEEMIEATDSAVKWADSGIWKIRIAQGMKEVLCQILTRRGTG